MHIVDCISSVFTIFKLNEPETSMFPCFVIEGNVDLLDGSERNEGGLQTQFGNRFFQASNIKNSLGIRPFPLNSNYCRLHASLNVRRNQVAGVSLPTGRASSKDLISTATYMQRRSRIYNSGRYCVRSLYMRREGAAGLKRSVHTGTASLLCTRSDSTLLYLWQLI